MSQRTYRPLHVYLMDLFRHRPVFRSIVLIAGGTASAQVVACLSTPVVTRLYLPEHFGVLTVFVSILGIAAPLATLRYAVTIPLAEDDELADNLLRLCLLITILISVLVALGLVLFGPLIAARHSAKHVQPYFWLLPICLFGAGLYEALSSWCLRVKQFSLIARTRLSQGISSAVIKIGLGWCGVRPLGLLLGYLMFQAAGCGSILSTLIRLKPGFLKGGSWSGIRHAAGRFVRFPLYQSWSQFLLGLGVQLPAMFLAAIYGSSAAGLYGLAYSMVNMPMDLVGQSVAQVYFAEIARYGQSQPKKILTLSVDIIRKLLVIAAGPLAVIVITGPPLFGLVFGDEWREAGVYARQLSVIILFRFTSSPIMHCLNVLERQGIQLFINSSRVLLIVAVFALCMALRLNIHTTLWIYSITSSAVYFGSMVIAFCVLGASIRTKHPQEHPRSKGTQVTR